MKKLLTFLLVFIMLISVHTLAIGEYSYLCKVTEKDMSGTNFSIYFMNCRGHFSNDTVTLYITNTSNDTITVQASVGYGGGKVQTSIESGFVELEPEQTGRFVLENLSKYPEKANDDLGYVPGSHLSENSVVLLKLQNVKAGDTFVVTGIDGFKGLRNTTFSDFNDASAVQRFPFVAKYVNESKLVIKDKEVEPDEKKSYEYTLEQPDNESVTSFITFVAVSAVVCLGGIVIYTISFIRKRSEKDD